MVNKLGPSTSGVVVSATASAKPVLTFRNFSLRCDKSDPKVSFQTPWNWELIQGKKLAIISGNPYLRYQLIACIAGLVAPVSGEAFCNGAISWPVGGAGGLDRRLMISDALDFLSTVYSDCLEKSLVSVDEFWELLAGIEVHHSLCIKELGRSQKQFFYLALSMLFSFDCYLIEQSKSVALMSASSQSLRHLFLKQLEGKTLITTSVNKRFRREFCTDGLVLGAYGEILFSGGLSAAVEWADQNLQSSETASSNDEPFEMGSQFKNDESSVDADDDF
tara:strand:+ start:198 stop:1028 length:831 start_codon:yes stop_codon:yes gene_type:complete